MSRCVCRRALDGWVGEHMHQSCDDSRTPGGHEIPLIPELPMTLPGRWSGAHSRLSGLSVLVPLTYTAYPPALPQANPHPAHSLPANNNLPPINLNTSITVGLPDYNAMHHRSTPRPAGSLEPRKRSPPPHAQPAQSPPTPAYVFRSLRGLLDLRTPHNRQEGRLRRRSA